MPLVTTSVAAGMVGAMYYYAMHQKQHHKQQEQEAFLNQLILDQPVDPLIRESLRNLIRRCSTEIHHYTIKKNIAILPLLVCAAGLGCILTNHYHRQTTDDAP